MARGRFDRHVFGLVLQVNGERLTKRQFRRRMIRGRDLLLAMFAEEFGQSRLCRGEMIGAQAFPNFFVVAQGARIIATRPVKHEIFELSFFPTFCSRSFSSFCLPLHGDRRRKIFFDAWFSLVNGPIAQRLEQGTHNPLVPGSNPGGPREVQFANFECRFASTPPVLDRKSMHLVPLAVDMSGCGS